jgi:hypothetical protein
MELRKQTNGRTLQTLYFKTVDVLSSYLENSLNRKD